MKRYLCATILLFLLVSGCISTSAGDEENIEGRWSFTIYNAAGDQHSFDTYITYQLSEIKVYFGESSVPLDGSGYVSDGQFEFSWQQENIPKSLFASIEPYPKAQITANIESGGNYMEGMAHTGNPLMPYYFTATKIDMAPLSASTSDIDNPYTKNGRDGEPDLYKSTCNNGLYAKVIPVIPDVPPANATSTVTIGGAQCVVSGNSDSGINTVQNASIVAHPVDSEVLFPGAMLDGSSLLSNNEMIIMDVGRAKGKLQLSDVNLAPGEDSYIETAGPVSALNVQQAIAEILPRIASSASNFNAKVYTSDSSTSLSLDLGIGFEADQIEASGSLSFDWSIASNFATYFGTQTYYTVNYVTPEDPDNGMFDRKLFFSDDTDTCSYLTNKDNPPVYISSVTYGMMFLATAQGMHSAEDIKEALDIAANTGEVGATVSSGATVSNVLNNTTITYSVYGGAGSSVSNSLAAANGNDMVLAWFNLIKDQKSAEYSIDNPGVPIFYTLKNAVDHTVVQLPYAVSFDSRHCEPTPPEQPTEYLYKFNVSSRSGEDVFLCINKSMPHSLMFNSHTNHASWPDIADYLNGDTKVYIFTDSYTAGKSHAYMAMYRRANKSGSTWGKIWHKNFNTTNYMVGTGQYAKTIILNKDGKVNKSADPIYWPLITNFLVGPACL
ncbi:MAG: hypothetical protein C0602_01365 [Denitrovibrio sp.]|nr:MAG: hypothetical protein C0602_01365 [Denitrovibrio sp.]